jgi:hypothetical protein
MKTIVMVLGVLLSLNTMAATILPIAAQDCTIAKTPSTNPTTPRAVENTNTYNAEAKEVLRTIIASNNYTLTVAKDLLSDKVTTYSLQIAKEEVTGASYPAAGCTRSATLNNVCLVDAGTNAVKCGEVCQYDYNCIDNR